MNIFQLKILLNREKRKLQLALHEHYAFRDVNEIRASIKELEQIILEKENVLSHSGQVLRSA